jgi:AmmeMemoRadiSam system protein B
MDREPAVAGRFYPAQPHDLATQVAAFLGERPSGHPTQEPPRPAVGLVAPHAGYVYSGAIAGAVYARIDVPERAILLGPNHTGLGAPVALWPDGGWNTPLGRVPVDGILNQALQSSSMVVEDREAHRLEHALEVQLPFLLLRRRELAISALCLGALSYAQCTELGRALARAAGGRKPALLVASSDMSHYLSAAEARAKDLRALDRVVALDPKGLYELVHREGITMCGFVPTTVMLIAALELGAREAELIRYGNSGDVTGDSDSVVGYAGVAVF